MVAPGAFYDWVGLTISSFNARLIHFFRIFLHHNDITFKLLRESTSYFGYNPRLCFNASDSAATLKEKIWEIEMRIEDVAEGMNDISNILYKLRTSTSDAPYMVFQLFPTNQSRSLSHCRVKAVSRWAINQLLIKCEDLQAGAVTRFYRQSLGEPQVASLQGHLFRWQVLNSLGAEHQYQISGSTNPDEKKTSTFRGRIQHSTEGSSADSD